MNCRGNIVVTISLALLALLLMGFWVGMFETFGGYVTRQRLFLGVSIALGLAIAWLLIRRGKLHIGWAGAFLVASHFTYVLGEAFGQAYYLGATSAGDFARTVLAALDQRL
jgi:hypothetical protein